MFLLLPFAFVLIGAIVVVAVVLRTRSRARLAESIETSPELDAVVRGIRLRMTVALLIFLVVGFLLALDPLSVQPRGWLGLLQALGGAVAAILACAVFVASPLAAWPSSTGVRTAELVPRGGGSFGPRWGFTLPLVSGGILVSFLVLTGLASSRDDFGLFRAFTIAYGNGSSTSSPYPGWFYGVPIIGATLVLGVVVLLALRRIALAPRPASPIFFDADDAARRTLTRFVMLLSSSALLLYFGAVAALAGQITSNAATNLTNLPDWSISPSGPGPDVDQVPLVLQSSFLIGRVELVLGVGLVLLGLVLLVAAAVTSTVRWAPSRESVDA